MRSFRAGTSAFPRIGLFLALAIVLGFGIGPVPGIGPGPSPAIAETPEAIDAPAAAEPGDVVPVRFGAAAEEAPDARGEFRVELAAPDGTVVAEGKSFVRKEERYSLLGVPSSAKGGTYELRVFAPQSALTSEGTPISEGGLASEGSLDLLSVRKIEIRPRSFAHEEIPLRQSLTALRRNPDPEKAREAVEIRSLYRSFDNGSVYEEGTWNEPVDYTRISGGFGDRRQYHYSDGATAEWIHTGVDLAAPSGTPVRAVGEGRVVMAKERIVSGYTVVLEHLPGVYSIYFHLDALGVEKGQMVHRDETIGTVGMTGLATGPHLHWEVRVQGVPVDPWVLTKKSIFDSINVTEEPAVGPQESEGG